jgi:2,4-diaminopentanoate dehydrogenase
VNAVQFGLGPIGMEILEVMTYESNGLDLMAAVDIDPEKAGKDIGALLGRKHIGIRVIPSVQDLSTQVRQAKPGEETERVAIHATGSNLEAVWPQIKELLDYGFSVVSTCEEIAYPWHRYPELSSEIDAYSRERGLSVLGTGVNPGFVMDTLVLCLTAITGQTERIVVTRSVDVSKRRLQLQEKVGVGMPRETFEQLAAEGAIGHVGMEESVRLVAYALNWRLTEVTNTIEPTIAGKSQSLALTDIQPGDVDGLHQTSVGRTQDSKEIRLDLTMRAEVEQKDEIVVYGDTRHRLLIPDGIFGDTATAAIAVNCAKMMSSAPDGLINMADIKVPRNTCF